MNESIIGKIFGRLKVIKEVESIKNKYNKNIKRFLCLCSCEKNKKIIINKSSLTTGNTKSCGCIKSELLSKRNTNTAKYNGDSKTKLYSIWKHMKQRCDKGYNKSDKRNYNNRNIKVCEEWYNFLVFKRWALENNYKDSLSIERIDVNGNYNPQNCTWIPFKDQYLNKTTSIRITINGVIKTIAEWSRISNISSQAIRRRYHSEWNEEKLLSPIDITKRNTKAKVRKILVIA